MDARPTPTLALALLLGCTIYNLRFHSRLGSYRSLMCWQLTICSIHIAPIVALRLALHSLDGTLSASAAAVAWMLISLRCRWPHRWTLFSLGLLALEAAAACATLDPRTLDGLYVLQLLIVTLFWAAAVGASCTERFSFLPIDRHLHLGLHHMVTSASARRCLLHELTGHLLSQASFALILRCHAPYPTPDRWPQGTATHHTHAAPECYDFWPRQPAAALGSIARPLGAYVLCVWIVAATLSPHQLPYSLGTIPKRLRYPVSDVPDWLRGDGALWAGEASPAQREWWMEARPLMPI